MGNSASAASPAASAYARWSEIRREPCVSLPVKRLKALKHPYILSLVDSYEAEDAVVMVTERCVPLSSVLAGYRGRSDVDVAGAVVWGLHSLITALQFLHNDAHICVGCLSVDSVVVCKGGEWKPAIMDAAVPLGAPLSSVAVPSVLECPERVDLRGVGLSQLQLAQVDAYALGVLIADVYGGPVKCGADIKPALSKVPRSLLDFTTRLLAVAPRSRLSDLGVLLSSCSLFDHPVISTTRTIEQLPLLDAPAKQAFFRELPSIIPRLPDAVAKYNILPSLMKALEFGAAGGSGTSVLGCILEIGAKLPQQEYARDVIPCVVRLFGNNDRATRVQLLHHLPAYIDKIGDDVVNAALLPSIVNGFADTSPVLRESTVKAFLHLFAKLQNENKVAVLSKYFKATVSDTEPSIRVNTVICVGRVAQHVSDQATREKLLLPLLMKALADPFGPSRAAGLRAATHCLSLGLKGSNGLFFLAETVARAITPAAAMATLDSVDDVREAALGCLDTATKCLRLNSSGLSEKAKQNDGVVAAQPDETATQVVMGAKAADAVASALGWAVSSLASRIIPTGSIDDSAGTSTPTSSEAQNLRNTEGVRGSLPGRLPDHASLVPATSSVMSQLPTLVSRNFEGAKPDIGRADGWDWDEDASKPTAAKPTPKANPATASLVDNHSSGRMASKVDADGWDWDTVGASVQSLTAKKSEESTEKPAPKLVLAKKVKTTEAKAADGWDEW